MQKQLPDTTITVPVPNHSELRTGTLQSIIRQSGVPRGEFESQLPHNAFAADRKKPRRREGNVRQIKCIR